MPTRQGWLAVLGGAALLVAGRLLGVLELTLLGCGVLLLVVGAVLQVRLTRLRLEVARDVHPVRVHAGSATRVELRATNLSERRSPTLVLRDPVSGTRGATLHVPPLRSGEATRAAYRLPTARRGIVDIGPLTVAVSDPFGLASITTPAAAYTELTVFPKVDDITPPPQGAGRDPHAGTDSPNALARSGEDFYALRPYVVGDDLRRVHWASTARHDELMVRQEELPWQGRTTVVLDTRRGAHTEETFERAVSAAASVVMTSWRRRDLVRLIATDGTDSGHAAGHAHVEALLEYLATVEVSGSGALRSVLDSLGRSGQSGALVAVGGRLPDGDVEGLFSLRRRFGSVTVVTFGGPSAPAAASAGARRSTRLVRVDEGSEFGEAWDLVMRRPGGSRRIGPAAAAAGAPSPAEPAPIGPSPIGPSPIGMVR